MPPCVLAQPTLVLNRSWTAIATTTVRHALGLVFSGTARAIRPESYEAYCFESWSDLDVPPGVPGVRTVTGEIRAPEVVALTRYNGFPKTTVTFSRRNLYRRDHSTCQYCGARPGTRELSVDHVLPRSRGGKSTWENCVLACLECNREKGDRTPVEARMRLRREPHCPRWTPAFELPPANVRRSWEQFVSDLYWDVELEP